MKKIALLFTACATLLTYQAFGQTISVLGTSGSTTPGGTFDSTISLQIAGDNNIGNVESLNMLLRTPSTGANSGVGLFTVQFLSPLAPFSLPNNPAAATFDTAGDANNSGFTVSSNTIDLGANAPAELAAPVNATGTTLIPLEVLRFTAAPNTPAGSYFFSVTLGGFADFLQGSYIANSANADFDINDALTFMIDVEPVAVPEPATWSLIGVGSLAIFGLNFRRGRRKD